MAFKMKKLGKKPRPVLGRIPGVHRRMYNRGKGVKFRRR